MQLLPLTLHEDPDIPEAVSPFVKVCIDGAPGLALLDTGAATSSVRDRPGLLTRSVMPRGTGLFGLQRDREFRADVNLSLAGWVWDCSTSRWSRPIIPGPAACWARTSWHAGAANSGWALDNILKAATVAPVVNQILVHIGNTPA